MDAHRKLPEPGHASSPPAYQKANALVFKAEFYAVRISISDDEFGAPLRFNGPIGDIRELVLNYRVDVWAAIQKIYVRNRFCRQDKYRVVAGVAYT